MWKARGHRSQQSSSPPSLQMLQYQRLWSDQPSSWSMPPTESSSSSADSTGVSGGSGVSTLSLGVPMPLDVVSTRFSSLL